MHAPPPTEISPHTTLPLTFLSLVLLLLACTPHPFSSHLSGQACHKAAIGELRWVESEELGVRCVSWWGVIGENGAVHSERQQQVQSGQINRPIKESQTKCWGCNLLIIWGEKEMHRASNLQQMLVSNSQLTYLLRVNLLHFLTVWETKRYLKTEAKKIILSGHLKLNSKGAPRAEPSARYLTGCDRSHLSLLAWSDWIKVYGAFYNLCFTAGSISHSSSPDF